MTDLDTLAAAKYISLTTYRADGTAVATPVWLVREGDTLVVSTQGDSGKVRRLRRNPEATVATCTARGAVTGPEVPAHVAVHEGADAARIADLVKRRYGLLGRLMTRRGSAAGRVGLVITVG
jgi:PPOX class probable F420-dependent enzyme